MKRNAWSIAFCFTALLLFSVPAQLRADDPPLGPDPDTLSYTGPYWSGIDLDADYSTSSDPLTAIVQDGVVFKSTDAAIRAGSNGKLPYPWRITIGAGSTIGSNYAGVYFNQSGTVLNSGVIGAGASNEVVSSIEGLYGVYIGGDAYYSTFAGANNV